MRLLLGRRAGEQSQCMRDMHIWDNHLGQRKDQEGYDFSPGTGTFCSVVPA